MYSQYDGVVAAPPESLDTTHHQHIQYEAAHALEDPQNGVVVSSISEVVQPDNSVVFGADANCNQLTLTYRGQVFVFDSVIPDKVQAVLLLLGASETPSTPQNMEVQQNQRIAGDFPGRCSQPQRAASLNRFRQKRKERCYDKKVRYGVRQEVALRMQRNKGQFTSSKKLEGDVSSGTGQESGQDENPQETSCTHCGISSKSTPMMRRGPSGPRSLCNACGLFWANRGTLKDLSKRAQDNSLIPTEQGAKSSGSNSGNGINAHSLVGLSSEDKLALIAEH